MGANHGQDIYAERLRVAHDIVEHLRSAGVRCGIYNGGVRPNAISVTASAKQSHQTSETIHLHRHNLFPL
jgi:hypothetical protein